MRNSATSGTLIFCASKPVSVPTASMSPPDINVCFAISMADDDSTSSSPRAAMRRLWAIVRGKSRAMLPDALPNNKAEDVSDCRGQG